MLVIPEDGIYRINDDIWFCYKDQVIILNIPVKPKTLYEKVD